MFGPQQIHNIMTVAYVQLCNIAQLHPWIHQDFIIPKHKGQSPTFCKAEVIENIAVCILLISVSGGKLFKK